MTHSDNFVPNLPFTDDFFSQFNEILQEANGPSEQGLLADSPYVIGMMSGTSLDGLDAVLCQFYELNDDNDEPVEILATVSEDFPPDLRAALLALTQPVVSRTLLKTMAWRLKANWTYLVGLVPFMQNLPQAWSIDYWLKRRLPLMKWRPLAVMVRPCAVAHNGALACSLTQISWRNAQALPWLAIFAAAIWPWAVKVRRWYRPFIKRCLDKITPYRARY